MAINDALATMTTPEARASVTRIQLTEIHISGRQSNVIVEIAFVDANDVTVRGELVTLAASAEVNAFIDALAVPLAGETGGIRRKTNYRVLSHLLATGKLPMVSSVSP